MLSIIYENIANLYLSQKDYDEVLRIYEKVKRINQKIGDPVIVAESNSNIAAAYIEMDELEYAMFNINSAITTFEQRRITDWLAYAYEIKGKIYLEQKKYKWALYWFRQSEDLHTNLEDEWGKIGLLNGMATVYLHQDKIASCESYAMEALRLGKKLGLTDGVKKSSRILYELFRKQQDYQKALEYHEIYQRTSQTLAKSENEKSLTLLKTKFSFDQQKEA